jgi:hypothetical protein
MLIAAMVGIDTRTTLDMDATIQGQTLTAPEIYSRSNRVGGHPLIEWPTSHTTYPDKTGIPIIDLKSSNLALLS